ncbi:MAG: SAM-dependent methyltransferase [Rhodanobacteraceae bacterium]|jgi:predicted O-methyltransferase YrrM|nr:SAM-dependent methyltransferase [Rhodanobacteraceae bacterium]
MTRQIPPTAALEDYVWTHTRESALARRLREETARLPQAGMQIGPDQAAFLALLARSIGSRRALEIGTFTGYSALAVAAALPPDGRLVCCDVNAEWTRIARRYWTEAGLAERIELRLAPALDTLAALRAEHAEPFDFAFIDADKGSYDAYYEACLALLRPGGLIALDNMLWSGRVADPAQTDADTVALRALNAKIRDDARVDASLLSLGDGVMLVRKRPAQEHAFS